MHFVGRIPKYYTSNPKDEYLLFRPQVTQINESTSLITMPQSEYGMYAFVTLGRSMGNLGRPVKDPAYRFNVFPEPSCTDCEKFVGHWVKASDRSEAVSVFTFDGLYRCNARELGDFHNDLLEIAQSGTSYTLNCYYRTPRNGTTLRSLPVVYLGTGRMSIDGTEYILN